MNHFEIRRWTLLAMMALLQAGCGQGFKPMSMSGSSALAPLGVNGNQPIQHAAVLATSIGKLFEGLSSTLADDFQLDQSGVHFSFSTSSFTDYRGQTIGGGLSIDNVTTSSISLSIPGVHVIASGLLNVDIGVHTTSPLSASFDLNDESFNISGGVVELIDNTDLFTASVQASNVSMNLSCRCPVSGSLSGSISDAFTASISISFNGCGSANVSIDGQSQAVSIPGCAVSN